MQSSPVSQKPSSSANARAQIQLTSSMTPQAQGSSKNQIQIQLGLGSALSGAGDQNSATQPPQLYVSPTKSTLPASALQKSKSEKRVIKFHANQLKLQKEKRKPHCAHHRGDEKSSSGKPLELAGLGSPQQPDRGDEGHSQGKKKSDLAAVLDLSDSGLDSEQEELMQLAKSRKAAKQARAARAHHANQADEDDQRPGHKHGH